MAFAVVMLLFEQSFIEARKFWCCNLSHNLFDQVSPVSEIIKSFLTLHVPNIPKFTLWTAPYLSFVCNPSEDMWSTGHRTINSRWCEWWQETFFLFCSNLWRHWLNIAGNVFSIAIDLNYLELSIQMFPSIDKPISAVLHHSSLHDSEMKQPLTAETTTSTSSHSQHCRPLQFSLSLWLR